MIYVTFIPCLSATEGEIARVGDLSTGPIAVHWRRRCWRRLAKRENRVVDLALLELLHGTPHRLFVCRSSHLRDHVWSMHVVTNVTISRVGGKNAFCSASNSPLNTVKKIFTFPRTG
jgi:hypothetical protein